MATKLVFTDSACIPGVTALSKSHKSGSGGLHASPKGRQVLLGARPVTVGAEAGLALDPQPDREARVRFREASTGARR